jgi:hypothetical protein
VSTADSTAERSAAPKSAPPPAPADGAVASPVGGAIRIIGMLVTGAVI